MCARFFCICCNWNSSRGLDVFIICVCCMRLPDGTSPCFIQRSARCARPADAFVAGYLLFSCQWPTLNHSFIVMRSKLQWVVNTAVNPEPLKGHKRSCFRGFLCWGNSVRENRVVWSTHPFESMWYYSYSLVIWVMLWIHFIQSVLLHHFSFLIWGVKKSKIFQIRPHTCLMTYWVSVS